VERRRRRTMRGGACLLSLFLIFFSCSRQQQQQQDGEASSSSSLRRRASFSSDDCSIEIYHRHLLKILLSLPPSLQSSSFSTLSFLQAALRAPEVAGALFQSHALAHGGARTGLNRFFRILSLKVEDNTSTGKKELLVVGEVGGRRESECLPLFAPLGSVVRRMAL